MNRREFILAAGAFSLAPSIAATDKTKNSKKIDESFAVIISDCHICGDKKWHANNETVKTLNQILALDPLPAKMIVMGDIAALVGLKKDYIEAKKVFAPIVDAGIEIAWMMGNHDRRDVFAEVFPKWAETSEVKGRIVHVVKMPSVDLVLLDSLDQLKNKSNHDGKINEAQIKWLEKFGASTKRPFFVCTHHDGRQMKKFAQTAIGTSKLMRGYIHGHRHSWMLDALHDWKDGGRLVRSIGMPSAALWGDIGFVTLRDKGDHAEFKIFERDCFFPSPDFKREESWDVLRKENDGAVVKVLYK